MAEKSDQTNQAEENLDLSGLSSMSLGPDWVSGKKPRTQLPREIREDRPRGRGGPSKDRRGFKPRRPGGRDGGGGRPPYPPRGERPERREREPFQPIVHVDFYPEEEPFRVLAQAIRTSYRTYELFEIARLILEKSDRFVCLVRDPAQKEGEPALLYASVPDGLPFRSEEEALGHVFRHYMSEFLDQSTKEVDPPAGSFQIIHKCGMTGELLGAPNYHRYQALCREHHAAKLAHVPYSKFEQRIETSREEADVQAWLEKMKVQTQYTLKEIPELVFGTAEDARLYLVTQCKDKLVRPAYSARFSGKALALLNPGDPIRRSVEFLLEQQTKFPLETANHLRGRLRRMHFAVYKRGSKGISFVCAVKRRFRKPDEVLADNLQELIDFLEAHQNFPAKDLPKAFLGINPVKKTPAVPTAAAKEVAEELGVPVKEDATESESQAVEPAEVKKPETHGEDELRAIQQLKVDLRYLVSEGYVTEYSDGRLFVPGIREEEIRHVQKQMEQAAVEDAVKDIAEPPAKEATASDKPESVSEPASMTPEPVPEPVVVKPLIEDAPAVKEIPEVQEEPVETVPIEPKVDERAATVDPVPQEKPVPEAAAAEPEPVPAKPAPESVEPEAIPPKEEAVASDSEPETEKKPEPEAKSEDSDSKAEKSKD